MIRAFLAVVLTVLSLCVSPAWAQDPVLPNYETWDRIATQSEQLVGNDDTTAAQLNDIRARIVDWRKQFQDAQGVNADPIATIESQIAALGPAPAEGETEPDDIAARRSELQARLSELQAPRLAAVEAFSRADTIVRRIDQALTDRQVMELARLSPSPLLPANWLLAASETTRLVNGIVENTRQRIAERATWGELRPRLPQVAGYLIAALLLLTLGRYWVDMLPQRLSARTKDYSRGVVAFILSLAQIVLPMIGVYLLISALTATGIFGPWTRPFLDALPVAGVILFGSAWLARQLFPNKAVAYDTLNVPHNERQKARWLVNALGTALAVHHVASVAFLPLSGLAERNSHLQRVPLDFAEGGAVVWHFALIVIAAALLFKLGMILRRLKPWADQSNTSYRHRVLSLAGTLTRPLAIAAVIAAAIGYVNVGNLLIWPWIQSMALLGVLILLQDFIADVFNMLKRGQEGARDGLAPLLIGFALVLLSIPVFLLIWGASGNELVEYWNRFRQGLTLGGVRLSPGAVLMFLLVFAIGYSITRAVQGALRTSVLPKTKLDTGGQNAVVSGIGYVGIILAAMLAITSAGIDLSSFAIVAGALSVGIGFGLQNIVSNFVSGIILLIERPVSVGDWISAGGQQGIVKRISVRATSVETFDKQQVIVPNSDLISQPVINWTRQSKTGRIIIPIGVSYGTDTRKVHRILKEIIEDQPLVTIDPAPSVLFRGITVDALNFEIRAVISDIGSGLGVTSEVYHQIVERFVHEGIGMPFTTRDIWKDGDLPLADEDEDHTPAPVAQVAQRELPDDGR
jgi:potassium efflux system protein